MNYSEVIKKVSFTSYEPVSFLTYYDIMYKQGDYLVYKLYPNLEKNNIYCNFEYTVYDENGQIDDTKESIICTYFGYIDNCRNNILFTDISKSNELAYSINTYNLDKPDNIYIAFCIPFNELYNTINKIIMITCKKLKSIPFSDEYIALRFNNTIAYNKFIYSSGSLSELVDTTHYSHNIVHQYLKIGHMSNKILLKSEYDCLYGFNFKSVDYYGNNVINIIESVEILLNNQIIFKSEKHNNNHSFDITFSNPVCCFLMKNENISLLFTFNTNSIHDYYIYISYIGYNLKSPIPNIKTYTLKLNAVDEYDTVMYYNRSYAGKSPEMICINNYYEKFSDLYKDQLKCIAPPLLPKLEINTDLSECDIGSDSEKSLCIEI